MTLKLTIEICLFILIPLIPPIEWILSYIHEIGHIIALKISAKILNITNCKSEIILEKEGIFFYKGFTKNQLYKHLENKKLYNHIRLNAIMGSLFCIFINLIIIAFIPYTFQKYHYTIPFILFIILELYFFFKGKDFKNFLHPEQFHYTE